MTLKERIELLLDSKKLTMVGLARVAGVDRSLVYNIMRPKRATARIPTPLYNGILKAYPEISGQWLETGEGEMLASPEEIKTRTEMVVSADVEVVAGSPLETLEEYLEAKEQGVTLIPEYQDTFKGGPDGSLMSSGEPIAYWAVPGVKATIISTVDGDSMAPKYPSGTKIVLKKIHFDPNNPTLGIPFGDVFCIVVDADDSDFISYIKILRRYKDDRADKYFIARSLNEEYDDFDIDVFSIRGLFVVVASVSLNRY